MDLNQIGQTAKIASRHLAGMSTIKKNEILKAMSEGLKQRTAYIIEENKKDLINGKAKGLSDALMDRLMIDESRIDGMCKGLLDIMTFDDPIGAGVKMWKRPNGIEIRQVKVPLGVVGMIYESRPNVTVDAAGLCLKSGNAIILRGGSEAINTNIALADTIVEAGEKAGMPKGAIALIKDTNRELVNQLIQMNDCLDVVIPRGGPGLKKAIISHARVPVIETGAGLCHAYVDDTADLGMAEQIVINAKTQRPGVCNAIETLLIHEAIGNQFVPRIVSILQNKGVKVYGCEQTASLAEVDGLASRDDWATEYLGLSLSVKVVDSIDGAIDHIYKYGSKHSEVIVTSDYKEARKFQLEVDASSVYVNASTRFTDGSEFGFGAEIGISTQKLHARGPMGLSELTTTKYLINGDGQIR